jgi:hypothetical protein
MKEPKRTDNERVMRDRMATRENGIAREIVAKECIRYTRPPGIGNNGSKKREYKSKI